MVTGKKSGVRGGTDDEREGWILGATGRDRETEGRGGERERERDREGEREIAREIERGPIDVGAGQVAPLIAPQRVQLCGPPAITAHSARHLTPRHPSNP